MEIFKFCKSYLLSQKYNIFLYIILTLLSSAISIVSPYVLGGFVDNLIEGADTSIISHFCIVFGGLSLIKILKNYATSMLYTKMQIQMGYSLNIDVIRHIQSLSLSFINHKDGMYLNQRINGDSYHLFIFCLTTLQNIILNLILLIFPFVLLLSLNSLITVIMIAFIFIYTTLYLLLKETLYKAGLAFKESQAKLFSSLYEQLKYIKLLRLNSIQPELNKRAENSFFEFKENAIYSQKANFVYNSLDGIVASFAQITLFVVGGLQVINGNFTIGMFTIFSSYFKMMFEASRYFFGLGSTYQSARASYNRIKDILKFKKETNGNLIIDEINIIDLKDISFNYNNFQLINNLCDTDSSFDLQKEDIENSKSKEKNVIHSFSAKFSKGNIYAITGSNGTGKSTIVNLITGLYADEYTGEIKYDGQCIRKIDMVSTRKRLIGIAEQEPLLINDSILYNLTFIDQINQPISNSSIKDTRECKKNQKLLLEDYLEILDMQRFIDENNLSFIINENNTNISGGEKQKISILKVLFKDPEVMIFDEPTSALDLKTTKKFIDYLQSIKKHKIIILITHNEYVATCCDEILNIKGCLSRERK